MPAPNTGGVFRSRIQDMKVGDYISCNYSQTGNVGSPRNSFGSLGSPQFSELPLTGVDQGYGFFYMIKVDKGLLIADRVIQNSVSWEALNNFEFIEGKNGSMAFEDNTHVPMSELVVRSLGGGNAFANADGTRSTTEQGQGAWPTNNEWDVYITKKDYGTGAGRDDVWHWNGVMSLCQETPVLTISGSSNRVMRGRFGVSNIMFPTSSQTATTHGFRPVFEYKEVIA